MKSTEDVLAELRALRRKGAIEDARWREQNTPVPPPIAEQQLRARRAERAAQAKAAAEEALAELAARKAGLAKQVPGRGHPGAARFVAEARRTLNPKLPHVDAAVLARTALAELVRQMGTATDPALVLDYLRELDYRAEQGDTAAEGEARRAAVHLEHVVAALPDIQKFAAEHDEIGRVLEYADYTLTAIAEGGEDVGERFDSYARVSAARAAGDTRPGLQLTGPDGSTLLALGDTTETRDIVGA